MILITDFLIILLSIALFIIVTTRIPSPINFLVDGFLYLIFLIALLKLDGFASPFGFIVLIAIPLVVVGVWTYRQFLLADKPHKH